MEAVLQSFLNGFPVLLMHFSVTLLMLVAGAVIYQMITPFNELDLIRGGNIAAALSFSAL